MSDSINGSAVTPFPELLAYDAIKGRHGTLDFSLVPELDVAAIGWELRSDWPCQPPFSGFQFDYCPWPGAAAFSAFHQATRILVFVLNWLHTG